MKVVGLLSGGKDSCYNLCHCALQGHEIVALASLGPVSGKEEIDSYMYQTVGQDGLHYIAQALELPLYRRTIIGTPVDQASDYASTSAARQLGRVDGDETEDLHLLLENVLAAHPDIMGVSVGAILSNYQRIRVEHVCARLNLQSLSYLWQYDQSQLLEDMAAAGMESVIIKVAGAGLGVKHLGQNVCSKAMREELALMHARWGTHPAGEGGEYETFTIDCPLFRKRIKLLDTEAKIISSGSGRHDLGTVAYLRLKAAALIDKAEPSDTDTQLRRSTRHPDLLDEEANVTLRSLIDSDEDMSDSALVEAYENGTTVEYYEAGLSPRNFIGIGEIACIAASVEQEMIVCFGTMQKRLAKHGLDMTSIAHINLYLSSMEFFPCANAVYKTFFGPSPPTRACVAVLLPAGIHVKMDVIAFKAESRNRPRTALHVQGLSYWAPANIGPYSQAVMAGERIFVAGQIGLLPADLTLPIPDSFAMEATLAQQHVRRIVKAMQEGTGEGFHGWMESCICWISGPSSSFAAKRDIARRAWSQWNKSHKMPFLIVQTLALPKEAQVEWQVTWQTGRLPLSDEDSEMEESARRTIRKGFMAATSSCLEWICVSSGSSHVTIVSPIEVQKDHPQKKSPFPLGGICSVRAFYTASISFSDVCVVASTIFLPSLPAMTGVQVLNIATIELDDVAFAFVVFSDT